MSVVEFPIRKAAKPGLRQKHDPCAVIILPVVRIEQHPQPFRGRRRQSRKKVLEKLCELQLELGRSL